MKIVTEYTFKTTTRKSSGNGKASILDSNFEKEIRENLLICFEKKQDLVIEPLDYEGKVTTKSNAKFNKIFATKLKDICFNLGIGYNGIVSVDGQNFVVTLSSIPTDSLVKKKR